MLKTDIINQLKKRNFADHKELYSFLKSDSQFEKFANDYLKNVWQNIYNYEYKCLQNETYNNDTDERYQTIEWLKHFNINNYTIDDETYLFMFYHAIPTL